MPDNYLHSKVLPSWPSTNEVATAVDVDARILEEMPVDVRTCEHVYSPKGDTSYSQVDQVAQVGKAWPDRMRLETRARIMQLLCCGSHRTALLVVNLAPTPSPLLRTPALFLRSTPLPLSLQTIKQGQCAAQAL